MNMTKEEKRKTAKNIALSIGGLGVLGVGGVALANGGSGGGSGGGGGGGSGGRSGGSRGNRSSSPTENIPQARAAVTNAVNIVVPPTPQEKAQSNAMDKAIGVPKNVTVEDVKLAEQEVAENARIAKQAAKDAKAARLAQKEADIAAKEEALKTKQEKVQELKTQNLENTGVLKPKESSSIKVKATRSGTRRWGDIFAERILDPSNKHYDDDYSKKYRNVLKEVYGVDSIDENFPKDNVKLYRDHVNINKPGKIYNPNDAKYRKRSVVATKDASGNKYSKPQEKVRKKGRRVAGNTGQDISRHFVQGYKKEGTDSKPEYNKLFIGYPSSETGLESNIDLSPKPIGLLNKQGTKPQRFSLNDVKNFNPKALTLLNQIGKPSNTEEERKVASKIFADLTKIDPRTITPAMVKLNPEVQTRLYNMNKGKTDEKLTNIITKFNPNDEKDTRLIRFTPQDTKDILSMGVTKSSSPQATGGIGQIPYLARTPLFGGNPVTDTKHRKGLSAILGKNIERVELPSAIEYRKGVKIATLGSIIKKLK